MAVTVKMIATALGQATPADGSITAEQWQMWIDDAGMLIQDRCDDVHKDIEELDATKVAYVIREAVVAHIRRPDDATQVTVSIDDGSSSKTYKSGRGRITILDEWWQLLGLTDPAGAFAIDTAPALYRMPVPEAAFWEPWL